MKVLFPVNKVNFASQNISNSDCTTRQMPSNVSNLSTNSGISNQEFYESIITLRNNITSFFSRQRKEENGINYNA